MNFHLIDIGIIGNNKLKLNDLDCLFSSLKFFTTSYNHKEAKFHLVVSLLQKDPEKPPIYLKSLISPPIFVDSRKSARNSNDLKLRHLRAFVEIFPIESLRRKYQKKEKKNNIIIENTIENNLKGLFDYLTAPNIRDKVKNPLFLAVKFNECVSFYYDADVLQKEKTEEIIKYYVKSLQNHYISTITIEKPKIFLLVLKFNEFSEDHFYIKKILEVYEIFKGSPLEMTSELEKVPNNFKLIKFESIEQFEKMYVNMELFNEIKKTTILSEDDEEDSEERYEEKPKKKIKIEIIESLDDSEEISKIVKKTTKNPEISSENPKIEEFPRIIETKNNISTEIQIFPKIKNDSFDFLSFFELSKENTNTIDSPPPQTQTIEKNSITKIEAVSEEPIKTLNSLKIELKEENIKEIRIPCQNKQEIVDIKPIFKQNTQQNPYVMPQNIINNINNNINNINIINNMNNYQDFRNMQTNFNSFNNNFNTQNNFFNNFNGFNNNTPAFKYPIANLNQNPYNYFNPAGNNIANSYNFNGFNQNMMNQNNYNSNNMNCPMNNNSNNINCNNINQQMNNNNNNNNNNSNNTTNFGNFGPFSPYFYNLKK